MARYRESDCVGCETCINCGRRDDYYVFECDDCYEQICDDEIYEYNGKDLCATCYAKATISNETVVECLEELLNELTEEDHEDFKWSLLVAIDKFK